ncbi:serine hydrolase domain-containing protein [Ectobacillus ponti]|uniref:Beta-lactamase family protein n=1 Tax=Ectobacillus ponti TaxID=2961894 RepID=A0AA41X8X4_9BACI|nr:serine hydrolase [Ectobacillus ponti]MCP8970967.1 beta-lactamase family protein [Ectobacillus ponti]
MNPNTAEPYYFSSFLSYMLRHKFSVAYDDYRFLPVKSLRPHPSPYLFEKAPCPADFSKIEYMHKGQPRSSEFHSLMEQSGTTALLIIRDGKILYEQYFNGHDRHTPQKLFSITKSFMSALVGIAVGHGYIGSVNDSVSRYLPEVNTSLTIRNLLQMDAGLVFQEGHVPWRDEAKVYLHPNARKLALSVKEEKERGFFHYNDYHLLLLGLILERTAGKSITAQLDEAIWQPLRMQFPGFFITDSEKHAFEKTESGLVMTAIDLAKFGMLYLRKGEWEGKQIVPRAWVEESTSCINVTTAREHFRYYDKHPWGKMWFRQNKAYYKYLWWGHLNGETDNDFFVLGALGQVLYISPTTDTVAIRLGKKWGIMDWWPNLLYKMIQST